MANTAKRTPGERIAELCRTYQVSLADLAERSGLDIALLERINGGYIPDLAPLVKIARALGVRLGTLLDDHEEPGPVITRKGGAAAGARFLTGGVDNGAEEGAVRNTGHLFHALAPDKGSRHMEPFIVDMADDENQPKSSHEGEEFIYVLEGAVRVDYGRDSHTLAGGDSIYYDSIVPHKVCSSGGPARILAVLYTPV
jgi:transcriptional regulator with XRE-family HTH domain